MCVICILSNCIKLNFRCSKRQSWILKKELKIFQTKNISSVSNLIKIAARVSQEPCFRHQNGPGMTDEYGPGMRN